MPDSNSELSDLLSSLPYSYEASNNSKEIKSDYERFEGKPVSVVGRIIAVRKSGKLLFADLLDGAGKIQAYFDYSELGEEKFESAKRFNAGDIIGVKGKVFKTKAGEVSVKAAEYSLLSKALRVLPDKWHGLQDAETRYRKRHLDLIMDPEIREVFRKRSRAISLMRKFLDDKGFMEFETPTIQPLYGGADAEPFKVFVNTLDEEHYLRIANELYLKRLIIGGLERVYEVYKAFRNEDIDSTHSPEFTMVEWYQAYADYNDMMKLAEEMLQFIVKGLFNTTEITYQGKSISFKAPFKRIIYLDSIIKGSGTDLLKLSDGELIKFAEGKGIKFEKGKRTRMHAYDKLFDLFVKPGLSQPTFVIDWPRESSPLTRSKRGNPELVERFELYVGGLELANSYSELNNPIIQRENFEYEMKKSKEGDKEAEPLDMDFVEAMEQGMPPTGGLGLGVDRLAMLLTDKASIKEVILFPMEKRLKS
jgi:lysyl-tRNA synthetase class 2